MSQHLADLAGTDPIPLRLLELADLYVETTADSRRFLEGCGAVNDALIAVGRKGQTAAHGDWYVLAGAVEEWHQLDVEPQRPGIDGDLYRADTAVLEALFKMIHDKYPCAAALHSGATITVGDLHLTSPGWLSCGACEQSVGAA